MKKVTNLKAVFGNKGKDKSPVNGSDIGTSILGNIKSGEFQLPRGISSIFQKTGTSANNLKNTLQRKKDKLEFQEDELEKAHRAYLAPPMPPTMTSSRLRRVNSSTLSLNRTKKKLLTVRNVIINLCSAD